jgi:short-chain fatty acids transporter
VGKSNVMARLALGCCAWAERWFPDAWVFSAIAVIIVSVAAMAIGVSPMATAKAFGDGYWNLIPFTMQMCFVLVGGHVVASSPPAARLIERSARLPKTGRGAIVLVALVSMLTSLVHWGLGLIFGALLVRTLGKREELGMDYRAATASAYLGLGAVWALGLSSSAAQLQANPASMPAELLKITGVIPFSETIFTWQSMLLTAAIITSSVIAAWNAAPPREAARSARSLGVDLDAHLAPEAPPQRPAEKLEHSPLLSLTLVALGLAWLWGEFAKKGFVGAIASLNTYNYLFLTVGLLLQWRPKRFLRAVYESVPATAGILIQFPLYAGIAAVLSGAKTADGTSLAQLLAHAFVSIASTNTFPVVVGAYSATLGFLVPSGGGKWLIEAPYVMQAANELQVHLGWSVQIYNAAEALPNLINPLFMLPLLAIVGLKPRDIIGYTFVQFLTNLPVVLFLLWFLAPTLAWHPPAMP